MGENAAAGVTGKEIWLDGEWVAWDDANIHVLTHTLHYGLGVFEGIRCYAGADGRSAIFRLPEHIKRYGCVVASASGMLFVPRNAWVDNPRWDACFCKYSVSECEEEPCPAF